MAELATARNNCLPYPCYGLPWVVTFPLLDADGDPISPSSPDSERSLNCDTFADCTNEATEIATSSGICYLLLTAAEMTADVVTVQIKSTGAKTTVLTFYPRKLVVLSTGTCQGSNDTSDIQLAAGDSAIDDTYNGCVVAAIIDTVTEIRMINDYVGSTKVAEIAPAWVTAQPDSNDTYTIYLVPETRQVQQANTTHVSGTVQTAGDIIGDTNDIQTRLPAALVSGRMDSSVGAMAANVLTAAATAADFGTEIAAAVWDALTAGMTTANSIGKKLADWVVGTISTYTGNTPQTGDAYARLGAPAGASVSADIAGVQSDTNDLQTRVPAALSNGFIKASLHEAVAAGVQDLFTVDSGETYASSVAGSVVGEAGLPGDEAKIIVDGFDTNGIAVAVGGIAAASFAAGAIDNAAIAADAIGSSELATTAVNEIRDAIFARAFSAAYNALTFDEMVKIIAANLNGKLSGAATTTIAIRNLADNADVVTATVDVDGNRTAMTVTP